MPLRDWGEHHRCVSRKTCGPGRHAGMDHGHPQETDEGQILLMGDCRSRIWHAAREEGEVEGAC